LKKWSFVLLIGGKGSRFGGTPKQYRLLWGRPLWAWSFHLAEKLIAMKAIEEIVVVVPEGDVAYLRGHLEPYPWARIVSGGKARHDSVLSGLKAAKGDYVLVHDGARPFADVDLCLKLKEEAVLNGAAVPVLEVNDALKKLENDGILITIPREGLLLAQTPQAYPREELIKVLARASCKVRDESEAWAKAGRFVSLVQGSPKNLKITYPYDWEFAKMMGACYQNVTRCGIGYDVHPLEPGRPLVLGGVEIPSEIGSVGHSDGDALCHALSDAILGACGEPDIGFLFPASDDAYKGASSMALLKQVVERVRRKGWQLVWADSVIILQYPKLAPFIKKIKESLGKVLNDSNGVELINVKAKSAEHIDSAGCGMAVHCHASVIMQKIVDAS